mgnify:CR=1 FL=1
MYIKKILIIRQKVFLSLEYRFLVSAMDVSSLPIILEEWLRQQKMKTPESMEKHLLSMIIPVCCLIGLDEESISWMSHGDYMKKVPDGFSWLPVAGNARM